MTNILDLFNVWSIVVIKENEGEMSVFMPYNDPHHIDMTMIWSSQITVPIYVKLKHL